MALSQEVLEAIGWCWAEACIRTDAGQDVREVEMGEILNRAKEDLE